MADQNSAAASYGGSSLGTDGEVKKRQRGGGAVDEGGWRSEKWGENKWRTD